MKRSSSPLYLEHGTVYLNGQPHLFITADYPYYRDPAEVWEDRLAKLKSLGLEVISAYIPWRHHQLTPDMEPDFTGQTQPNRNVIRFFELCQSLNLAVIAKPGPFIHGETNFGGLPDWTCSLNNPAIEPLLDAQGQHVLWGGARLAASGERPEPWPLPAPFGPEFLRLTREWLTRVGEQVIQPFQSPNGPIIAIQVGNEGIYSNGQHAPWAYDYSPSGLALYQNYLADQYQTVARYNALHDTQFANWQSILAPTSWQPLKNPCDLRQYMDWGAFQAEYMHQIFETWRNPVNVSLPVIVNQNPPLADAFGLDAWLTRVEPERWTGVHYGFTNWVGDVAANPSAFDRYLLTAKRYPGINMEENWGFAELYDPAYVDAATSFYQTLAILNAGATGFNIYTGVGTGHLDLNLEVLPKAPYPDASPITHYGEVTPKAKTARWLIAFMHRNGREFLTSIPAQPVAWGLYLPHARVAAWVPPTETNPGLPALGKHLQTFQSQMRTAHLDYGILNLETASLDDCLKFPYLVVSGGMHMARATQEKLVAYVEREGKLMIVGALPELDETCHPCPVLASIREQLLVTDTVNVAAWFPTVARPTLLEGQANVWVRSHSQKDVHFITVLIPAQGQPHVRADVNLGGKVYHLALDAASTGGAILRIENGTATAGIIKGHNGYLKVSVPPSCTFNGQTFASEKPGDLFWMDGQVSHLSPVK